MYLSKSSFAIFSLTSLNHEVKWFFYERWGFLCNNILSIYFERAIFILFDKTGYDNVERQY